LLIANILERGSNQNTELNSSLINRPMGRLTKRKKEGAIKQRNNQQTKQTTVLPNNQPTNQPTNQRKNDAT
jgi:hypothetical protein